MCVCGGGGGGVLHANLVLQHTVIANRVLGFI